MTFRPDRRLIPLAALLVPLLDVVDDALPAIALYERRGWVYVDERLADWTRTDGVRPVERRYRLPL